MTQRTLEKLNRAVKALEIAKNSLMQEVSYETQEKIDAWDKEWERMMHILWDAKKFADEAETQIYLANKEQNNG